MACSNIRYGNGVTAEVGMVWTVNYESQIPI